VRTLYPESIRSDRSHHPIRSSSLHPIVFDPATLAFTLSGTAAPGDYTFRVVAFNEDGAIPLFFAPLSFTVSAAAAPELAATGLNDVSPALAVLGALLVLAGAGAVAARRVHAAR